MRILIDECVPKRVRGFLTDHYALTVQQAGLGGYKNGQLLRAAENQFDVLITSDKNLRYQQNLRDRRIAILLLSTNNRKLIVANAKRIQDAVNTMSAADFLELELLRKEEQD